MFYGWRVVGICFVIALCSYGLGFYGVGVYVTALGTTYGWSSALVSLAVTAYYVLGACFTLFVGDAMLRFGPRRLVLLGGLMLGGGLLGIAATSEVWQLFGSFLAMSAGWGTMSAAAVSAAVAPWFNRKRGLAVSLALTGGSCGGAVAVPLLLWLTGQYGFGGGLRIAVAGMWMLVITAVLAWRFESPAALQSASGGLRAMPAPPRILSRPVVPPVGETSRSHALSTRRYWLVQLPFALSLAAQVGFLTHQVGYLLPLLGRPGAGLAVSLTTGGMVVGRIVVGAGSARFGSRASLLSCLALQGLGMATMMGVHTPTALYAACFIFGFGGGNLTSLPAVAVQEEFAPSAFARMISMVVAGNQFMFAFGPVSLGLLRDLTGGYLVPLAGCLTLEVIAAGVLVLPRAVATIAPDPVNPVSEAPAG